MQQEETQATDYELALIEMAAALLTGLSRQEALEWMVRDAMRRRFQRSPVTVQVRVLRRIK